MNLIFVSGCSELKEEQRPTLPTISNGYEFEKVLPRVDGPVSVYTETFATTDHESESARCTYWPLWAHGVSAPGEYLRARIRWVQLPINRQPAPSSVPADWQIRAWNDLRTTKFTGSFGYESVIKDEQPNGCAYVHGPTPEASIEPTWAQQRIDDPRPAWRDEL